MNTDFEYILDRSSKKFICPGCGKRRFVRYVDAETYDYLPEKYGKCDRAVNCTYHLNPYKDGYGKNPDGTGTPIRWNPPPPEPPKPISFIDPEIFKASRAGYNQNNFVLWLQSIFNDDEVVSNLISKYHLGTSRHWPGAVVFWQIDDAGKIRSGKIMGYDPTTGHRIKLPYYLITWAHKALKLPDFNLKQVYFGEHLLRMEPSKPVALVESEKTAVVASAYLPGFIWLAVGSLTNLNIEKCKSLAGRKVVLFPDLGCFNLWTAKAIELEKAMPGTRFVVSDLLEKNATEAEREKGGYDLCDYLERYDFRIFNINEPRKGEKGEKRDAVKTNYLWHEEPKPTKPHTVKSGKSFFLFNLIKKQVQSLNPECWIIDPDKNPELTEYNISVLSDDIFYKHGFEVTHQEYLRIFNQVKLFLN